MLASRSRQDSVEFMGLDFKDAFKQLHVDASEQRYLSGCFSGGWFLYLRILFGIVSGPLVWGRVAAAIMRATQALAPPRALRVACFVDDPFLTAFGSPSSRSEYFAIATLFWCLLGFRLAWSKGHRGFTVPWIGASLHADNERGTITVTLPAEKRAEAEECIKNLQAQGARIRRKDLRQATGKVEWIAGLLPQLRPFTQVMWAALASPGSPTRVWAKQVASALTWLLAFFQQESGLITRIIRADKPRTTPVVAFDASPFGMGAILWVVPAGTELTIRQLEVITPFAYMYRTWEASHEHLVQARIGDPAGQARWEALAMLLAFRTWDKVIATSFGQPVAMGDALGMLFGAARFRSKDPTINRVFMEMALLMAPRGSTLDAIHIWSEENYLADLLSRRSSNDEALPLLLAKVPRSPIRDGAFSILGV